jgi:zinc protease
MARRLLGNESRIVLALAPQKPDIHVPTDSELAAAIARAEGDAITRWSDVATAGVLMAREPSPGGVVARRELTDLGVTIVSFANGVEAWFKPTTFKNDQVVFTLEASGGASLASPADYVEASLADGYVRRSGVGGLSASDVQRLLAGRTVSVSPFISLSTHGVSGSATPADLETALQLVYQAFTAPGDDPEAFAVMKRQLDAAVANRERAPGQVFGERLAQVNTSNHYTAQPLTADRVAALDRGKMIAFYRERFSNAADFAFFMVGAFQLDAVVPLAAKYIGALPSTGRKTSRFTDLTIHFPETVERVRVEKGQEARGQTVMSFFADPSPDPIEQEHVAAATSVLQMALRDILREDLGQTYGVSVGLVQALPQHGYGRIEVSFGSAPENIDAMVDRVLAEIRRLQEEGPSADLTGRAKESARRSYETALTQNGYWLRRLATLNLLGQEPANILRRRERIDAVTSELLREVFRRYFPMGRYTVVMLRPAS